jgi:bisphosphoglycerate-dependent phosphoglycerate mutase
MENSENTQISFDEIKELYKDMLKERAKEKYRLWDREYKKMRYETDPEFREKQKQYAKERRERIKATSESVKTS